MFIFLYLKFRDNSLKTYDRNRCNTDLKDDDMEVTVLRGLSYNVVNPKTIDTYVRFEVPVPNIENPSKDKTNTVKDTNSPEYNETFHVNISRQSRTLLRIFKAKVIKFEVWAKGYLKLIFFLMNFYYFFLKWVLAQWHFDWNSISKTNGSIKSLSNPWGCWCEYN